MSETKKPDATPVTELVFKRWSHRIIPMMRNQNIQTLGDFQAHTETELLRTPNFGPATLAELKRVLNDVGHSIPV